MVRWFADNKGRFHRRPHYDPAELDQECERLLADFRRDLSLPSSVHITTDDISKLIERHVDDLDLYADLSSDGDGVEGVTLFASRRKPAVGISEVLSGDDRRSNRLRTTLTHELGHVHLHDPLYQTKLANGNLFSDSTQERLACKRDTMVDAPQVDWLEWQACYFSGAMLMPRTAMIALAREHSDGVQGAPVKGTHRGTALVEAAVGRFEVSYEAATVRLSVLGLLN